MLIEKKEELLNGILGCIHFCCGGVRFNKNAQVICKDGSAIEGLYVCGEASGGPHGHNRMGGVALTSAAFVFGKIVGETRN